jgi:hypothetical protein
VGILLMLLLRIAVVNGSGREMYMLSCEGDSRVAYLCRYCSYYEAFEFFGAHQRGSFGVTGTVEVGGKGNRSK